MKTIKLKDILSISGKGGLYRFIAQARNGIVVESLEDKKRHIAPATARVSALEDIAIFTREQEVPLSDIFFKIHEETQGKEVTSHKSEPEELKHRFEELVPGYDDERVYPSDIRKVFQWYNQMLSQGLLEVVEKEEEGSKEAAEEVTKPGTARQEPESVKEPSSRKETPAKKEPLARKGPVVRKAPAARKTGGSK
jgi:hypothetical protein